ncbi:LOW QUALITY PROTEIN: thyroid adenoma-associated protein homolog [Drosophila obscura]|uniref:LOW QUALITY PROTEIN: thyroid adenoma-associated protein homolog n=1 Tax=Drosophila obscura TaxID=7282 RepID=UPI001BB169F2|nr:LOW QUALITY PROTEIN: thyroid adenoma-associated protein homolog [Drosophila obscura]
MNDLNLRVTAIKLCAHPKRFAELRDALVPVPNKWTGSPHSFVQQFATASTSAEQVSVIRGCFHALHEQQTQAGHGDGEDQDQEQRRLAVEQFLASVLFASPLKHSVRNQLIKLFSDQALAKQLGQPQHTKPQLLAALRAALRELAATVASTSTDTPLTHDQVNDVFVSTNACLQNFPYGREALGHELDVFLPLLGSALERYWLDISNSSALELSPTRLNELYLFVQNVLRFHVGVLSEWGDRLESGVRVHLRSVQLVAEEVARHRDTPWDVRSIAGLVIGKNARFFDRLEAYLDESSQAMPIECLPIQAAALNVLLPDDYQRYGSQAADIVDRLMELTSHEGSLNNVLVYMAKHLHAYSKSLGLPVPHLLAGPPPQRQGYERILYALQRFALANICSGTDSVRHMCGGIFMQILQHGQACGLLGLFQAVYLRFEEGSSSTSSGSLLAGCLAMEKLVSVQGAREAIRHCPSLFGRVFPEYLGVDDAVDSLFKAMMVASRKEQTFEDWCQQWLNLLLRATQNQNKRLSAIEGLITQAVKEEPQALRHIWLQNDTAIPFSTILTAILSARNDESNEMRQYLLVKHSQMLRDAVVGQDDHLRLLTLRFVGAAALPSQPVSVEERAIIGYYLKHNINNPSAHIRQLGFGHMLKVIRRIELCLAEHRKRPTATGADQMDYLRGFMALLADNLFHSANYGRRWLSLRLLQSCAVMCSRLDIPMEDILTANQAACVESCLWDSYEHNKLVAAELLIKLQPCTRIQPDTVMELLVSLRPPDSLTGAYLLQVHCQAKQVETQLVPCPADAVRYQPRIYAALQWCLQPLREALALATTNLAEAAKLSPMYGLLLASRHLIELLAMQELAREPLWRQYVQELVDVCMAISEVVLPVVSSVAPEGYLPETSDQETDQEVANVLRRRLDAEALRQIRTTPQMVLLCAWRSIKEVSNILGGLVERSPLEQEHQQQQQQQQKDDATYLLSASQLTAIGDHFLLLLAEIKHRGAFEQAYVGFSMLCRRFWHSDAAALNQLPTAWVNEALDMIEGKQQQQSLASSQSRLCPTRRSAGIPYMLQALVCSELKLGTHNTLHRCMIRLLKVCESPPADSDAPQAGAEASAGAAHCHALNIMRALFRSSELADLVGEFVARGIVCTLNGLLATDWAEQNSASLLLATLVVRVFGVERPRDDSGELHVRNRMTGRIFFTRYPELYNYFSQGLARAAQGPRPLHGAQKIHLQSMLMLLSRLYPSSMEGAESTLKLSNFVPDLLKISLCADVLTREKAASVVGNFVDDQDALVRTRRILDQMLVLHERLNAPPSQEDADDGPMVSHNRIHGQERLLLELYRRLRWSRPNLNRMMLKTLSKVTIDLLDRSLFLFNGMLEVLVAILEDVAHGQVEESVMVELRRVYELSPVRIYEACQRDRLSPKIFQIFGLHLHRLEHLPGSAIKHIVTDLCKFSGPMPMAIEELKGELLLYVALQDLPPLHIDLVNAGDVKVLSFSSDIVRYHKALTPDQRHELGRGIASSPSVHTCLRRMYVWGQQGPPNCWSLQLAGRIGILQLLIPLNPAIDLERLLEFALENNAAHVHFGLVLAIKRLMDRQEELSQPIWIPLLEYAQILCYATQPVYLRHKAIGLCERIGIEISRQLFLGDLETLGRFARLVLLLLVDDDEGLRNDAAVMADQMDWDRVHPKPEPKKILANVVLKKFLKNFIDSLEKYGKDNGFLLRLFSIIIEPFLLMAQETPSPEHGALGEDGADVDLFDKQGCNLYCETLMVIREVADSFTEAFPQDTALLSSIAEVLRANVVWSRSEWN